MMTLTRLGLAATTLSVALVLGFGQPALAMQAEPGPDVADQEEENPGIPVILVTDDDRTLEGETVAIQNSSGGRSWYFDLRGGAYFDVDEPFIGAGFLFPLTNDIWFNPNVEWIFVDNADLATVNFDAHLDLPTSSSYSFWVGAGLGLEYFDPDGPRESDWDPGLNLLAGLGFGHGPFIPYVQGKLFINDDNTEFVLAGGVRF